MLALPLQRIVAIDSAPIFRGFVNKSFGAGANERFEVDIRGFQNARDTALNVTQSTDESGLNYVLHMVYQLRNMAPRFAEYETELMICYTYYDAFKPTRKITSRTLFYDLSVFLWNYAALHSHVGSRIDRSSDEGIKVAQRHYQYAAGALDCIVIECLHRMKDSTGANFGPINVGVINMCKELMLAQGQLCFYEKAVKDRKVGLMKPAIIAKLAAQTAIFYKSAAEMSKQGSCAAYVDESWGVHAEFQHRCFNAAAEYWMSQSEKEAAQSKGAGYGIEIARLNKAEIMQQDAINFATKNKLGVSSTNGAASLLRTVTSAKNTAVHDNRTVYMESVPAEGSLTAVSAVSLVKPSEPPEYGGMIASLSDL
jgi:programmed cell death 6-interacting protein